ncbi:unnamed protein product [Calypogeia fissa]
MQSLVGLSSRSGIAGIPCQFSNRAVTKGRRNCWGSKIRAAAEDGETSAAAATEVEGGDGDDFEDRLAKLQRKVTSGTGKKAEARKARKEAGGDPYAATSGAATKSKKDDLFIPPVPLKEPVSDGLTVELGMTPYTERFHGRLAALGLAAVLLVELATGDSFIKYHDTGTLTVQVYTVLGLAALFLKYEKEKISIWPK